MGMKTRELFKEAPVELARCYARNEAMLQEYAASFKEWSDLLKEIDDLRHSERLEPDAVAFLKNEIGKLEQIDLSEEAISELESNYLKITQAQELQSLLQASSQLLSAESGINEQLNALVMKLSALKDLDASSLELFERAEAMQIESDDLTVN